MMGDYCAYCGGRMPLHKRHRKYCSSDCYRKMLRSRKKIIKCKRCGKKMLLPPSSNRKYCSSECFHEVHFKYKTLREPFGKLLVFVKERTGISRTKLADLVGVNLSTVTKIMEEENDRIVERMKEERRI